MIKRQFQDIPEGKLTEADQRPFLMGLGWSRATKWDDLLRSRRILLISEAGAGKTHECKAEVNRSFADGAPAFCGTGVIGQ